MESKFEIKKSKIEGKGMFAIKPLQKGELICRMKGEKISISELDKRFKNGTERLTDPLQIKELKYLDIDKPYIY